MLALLKDHKGMKVQIAVTVNVKVDAIKVMRFLVWLLLYLS